MLDNIAEHSKIAQLYCIAHEGSQNIHCAGPKKAMERSILGFYRLRDWRNRGCIIIGMYNTGKTDQGNKIWGRIITTTILFFPRICSNIFVSLIPAFIFVHVHSMLHWTALYYACYCSIIYSYTQWLYFYIFLKHCFLHSMHQCNHNRSIIPR